jgi:hypothetical protein
VTVPTFDLAPLSSATKPDALTAAEADRRHVHDDIRRRGLHVGLDQAAQLGRPTQSISPTSVINTQSRAIGLQGLGKPRAYFSRRAATSKNRRPDRHEPLVLCHRGRPVLYPNTFSLPLPGSRNAGAAGSGPLRMCSGNATLTAPGEDAMPAGEARSSRCTVGATVTVELVTPPLITLTTVTAQVIPVVAPVERRCCCCTGRSTRSRRRPRRATEKVPLGRTRQRSASRLAA